MSDGTIVVVNETQLQMNAGQYRLSPGIPTRVPLEFLAQFGHVKGLRFDYSDLQEFMKSRDDDGTAVFDFWCPLSAIDGYGRHALAIWKGLRNLGHDAKLRNSGQFVDRTFLPSSIVSEAQSNMGNMPSKVAVAMTVPYDDMLWANESITKIAITQFETDRVPEKHVEKVNKTHHLIVTSSFGKDLWKKCGVRIPIDVMTPGVDTEFFTEIDRQMDGTFKVLLLGALTSRKNPLAAIRIFRAASKGNADWRLKIKTRPTPVGFKEVSQMVTDLHDPRISIDKDDVPPEGVKWYYHNNDCLLWPSRGEGVGLPPLEAMSTGMEVVLSNNTGMMDYIDKDHCWPVRMAGKVPANSPDIGWDAGYIFRYGDVGNMYDPDENDAAHQLEKCFNDWREGRGKGHKAAAYVRAHHTLQ